MTDPFLMKALFATVIIAIGLTLAIHSRLSRLDKRDRSAHSGTAGH